METVCAFHTSILSIENSRSPGVGFTGSSSPIGSGHFLRSFHPRSRKPAFSCSSSSRSPIILSSSSSPSPQNQDILWSLPVSNYAGRSRYLIYKKKLPVNIQTPEGGLKTETYIKQRHPYGKVPSLTLASGESLFESEVINEYLEDQYSSYAPQFLPLGPEHALLRAQSRLVSRLHDIYLGPYHGCLYRAMDSETRQHNFEQFRQGLQALRQTLSTIAVTGDSSSSSSSIGPYLLNTPTPTLGDAALFPSFVFYDYMASFFGTWRPEHDAGEHVGRWYRWMKEKDPEARRVYEEIWKELEKWEQGGRWEKLGMVRVST